MQQLGRTLIVASVLTCAACAQSRVDSQPHQVALPDRYPGAPQSTRVALADPWWSVFNDPQLSALIAEALEHNKDIGMAASRVVQSRASLQAKRAAQWPAITAQAGASRARVSSASFFGLVPANESFRYEDFFVQGTVSYEVDVWGRYLHSSRAARARFFASELDRDVIKLSVSGDVARSYFRLVAANERLAAARAALQAQEEALTIEKALVRSGEDNELSLRQLETDTEGARAIVAQVELQAALESNALEVLLGREPQNHGDQPFPPADNLRLAHAPAIQPGLPSELLERRPDVKSAEAALTAASADVKAARAELFPHIGLTGAYGSESGALGAMLSDPSRVWSLAGGLVQPVFEGGKLRAAVAQAIGARSEARERYAATVQNAFREVLDAIRGQESLADIESARATQLAARQRASELTEQRYQQGDLSYLKLLESRRNLYQAQIDLTLARCDTLLNVVTLALAVGGGLGPPT